METYNDSAYVFYNTGQSNIKPEDKMYISMSSNAEYAKCFEKRQKNNNYIYNNDLYKQYKKKKYKKPVIKNNVKTSNLNIFQLNSYDEWTATPANKVVRKNIGRGTSVNNIMFALGLKYKLPEDSNITIVENNSLSSNSKVINKNNNIAVCAIAKNENLYIREWVLHYKDLGIKKIFLYDNNDIDGEKFEDVISDYINDGFVEVIDKRGVEKGLVYDNSGINLQTNCYIDCYENRLADFDWVCFFDIDEFLVLKNGFTLNRFLNQQKFANADTIVVSWEHYDDNDNIFYEDKPVVKRFSRKSSYLFYGLKSICRTHKEITEKTVGHMIHIFRLKGRHIYCVTGDIFNIVEGKTWYLLPKQIHDNSEVVLNHYKTKSLEEFIRRQLNRHWGTTKSFSLKNAQSIADVKHNYFIYNKKTPEKEQAFKKYKTIFKL